MTWSCSRRPDAGFSLLEVLVTLFILALVAGIATVQFRNADRVALGGETRALTAILRHAQQTASARGQQQVVAIDVDAGRITHGELMRDLPDGIEISLTALREEQTSGAVAGIRFHPDGISSGGRITLRQGAAETAVFVHWLGGAIVVETP